MRESWTHDSPHDPHCSSTKLLGSSLIHSVAPMCDSCGHAFPFDLPCGRTMLFTNYMNHPMQAPVQAHGDSRRLWIALFFHRANQRAMHGHMDYTLNYPVQAQGDSTSRWLAIVLPIDPPIGLPLGCTGWFKRKIMWSWSVHWSTHLERIHASPIDLLCSWTVQRMSESMSRWCAHWSTYWFAHWQYYVIQYANMVIFDWPVISWFAHWITRLTVLCMDSMGNSHFLLEINESLNPPLKSPVLVKEWVNQ